jgi:hypothetical protein
MNLWYSSFLVSIKPLSILIGTSGAGTAYYSWKHDFTLGVLWGSCYSIFSFLCSVLYIIVCPFVLFLLDIALSVRLFTNSDYPFGTFKLFFSSCSTSDPPSCYSSYKVSDKSWKRKVPLSVYDKWNISVVICDTDIL